MAGWDIGDWTADLYRAEQEASRARREKLTSAVHRMRMLKAMGPLGAALASARRDRALVAGTGSINQCFAGACYVRRAFACTDAAGRLVVRCAVAAGVG